jgi:hypothetical protein
MNHWTIQDLYLVDPDTPEGDFKAEGAIAAAELAGWKATRRSCQSRQRGFRGFPEK